MKLLWRATPAPKGQTGTTQNARRNGLRSTVVREGEEQQLHHVKDPHIHVVLRVNKPCLKIPRGNFVRRPKLEIGLCT